MPSIERFLPRRRRAVAVALALVLGPLPGVAADERAGNGAGAGAASVETAAGDSPPRGLTLRDALVLALKQSPELASFSWEPRAR